MAAGRARLYSWLRITPSHRFSEVTEQFSSHKKSGKTKRVYTHEAHTMLLYADPKCICDENCYGIYSTIKGLDPKLSPVEYR